MAISDRITPKPRGCSVKGCERPHKARGMCKQHDRNMQSNGHPEPRRDWPVERVLDYIGWDVTSDGCWEWRGDRNELGYGRLTLVRKGLDKARVHRIMFERYFGPIPDGSVVRHKCDNPPCCNPDHLELGTMAENMADMIERGRHRNSKKTRCKRGHSLLDPANVKLESRANGKQARRCRACKKMLRH